MTLNKQTERMRMSEILKARYILQRRSDDHLIACNVVEPNHRSGNVADSFLAFRTQEEAEAYRGGDTDRPVSGGGTAPGSDRGGRFGRPRPPHPPRVPVRHVR